MSSLLARITAWWRGIDPHRLEAIGAFILLVAALWEALALRHADDLLWQWVIADLNDKLKHLFTALESDDPQGYARANMQEFLAGNSSTIDFYEDAKNSLSLSILGEVRAVLFAIGSILIVAGKWRQGARKRPASPEAEPTGPAQGQGSRRPARDGDD